MLGDESAIDFKQLKCIKITLFLKHFVFDSSASSSSHGLENDIQVVRAENLENFIYLPAK